MGPGRRHGSAAVTRTMILASLVVMALVVIAGVLRQAEASDDGERGLALEAYMKQELNPAFSDLSFQLFHGVRKGDAPPADALVAASGRFALVAGRLAKLHPPGTNDETAFNIHAV